MADTATKPAPAGPKTIDMVRQAIEDLNDKKGASVISIKSYILKTWPDVNPNLLKSRLKKAVEKGFEQGLFVRPAKADTQGPGLTGRIKINKDHVAAEEKAKKAKAKATTKKAVTAEKPTKSPSKAKAVKKAAVAKSPGKKLVKAKKTDADAKTKAKAKSKASPKKKAVKPVTAKQKLLQSKAGMATPKKSAKTPAGKAKKAAGKSKASK